MRKLYVYGTLRQEKEPTIRVKGRLHDLGWYPGIVLDESAHTEVTVEPMVVTDTELVKLDQYEGYFPEHPEDSLFTRVPFLDGEMYVYNRSVEGRPVVDNGDWLSYIGTKR